MLRLKERAFWFAAWGNCNIEWTAHAETTPVVQEPSQRDMTGEAHTHTSV